ncbi:MAG TPA: hypothetical protein VIG99_31955 [Myxococcaceae bacterium]
MLRAVCAIPGVRPQLLGLVDVRRRALWIGLGCVATSAVIALRAPMISLWLGVAVLGVPHVVSGIRHLAVRRRLSRATWCFIGAAALTGVLQLCGAGVWTGAAISLLFTGAMASEAVSGPGARLPRRLLLVAFAALFGAASLRWPLRSTIVLSHAHAWCSMACLALLARRRAPLAWVPMAAAAAVVLGSFAGAFDAWLPAAPYLPASAADSLEATRQFAAFPNAGALAQQRALFAYAFGQALHYSIWVRLVPDVDRPASVPQSFRVAWARLRADLGRWAVPLAAACAVAPAAILLGGSAGHEAYFTLVYFHVGLEAAGLVALLRSM